MRKLLAFSLIVLVATTACAMASPKGELVDASVSLDGTPNPEDSEISILVTFGGCSGGTIPTDIESVEVEEDQQSVVIQVLIRLPVEPFPTTCPENPTLHHTVSLESQLGDRVIEARVGEELVRLWADSDS